MRWVGLIRAIGPATHRVMPMAALRQACEAAGFVDVCTVLATGNVVFDLPQDDSGCDSAVQARLQAVVGGFGLSTPVFVRDAAALEAVSVAGAGEAVEARPERVLVLFLDRTVAAEEAGRVAEWGGPERIRVCGREIFIDYVEGVGRSRLTPAVLERLLRQRGTARNWNTVQRLRGLLRAGVVQP